MQKRNIYLKTVPVAEALHLAMDALDRDSLVGRETIPAHQTCGRVTAQAAPAAKRWGPSPPPLWATKSSSTRLFRFATRTHL